MRILPFNNLKIYGVLLIVQVIMLILHIGNAGLILPNITIMLIFFFSIIEETRPNYFFLTMLGVIVDAYLGSIIGTSSLGYVLVSLVASSNKKALNGQKFNIVWAAFAVSLAIYELIKFGILMFFNYAPNLQFASVCYLLNISLYPILHYIIAHKHHWFRLNA